MKNRAIYLLFLCSFLLTFSSEIPAASEVRQFFPDHPALLGEPVFWSIKLHYPLDESYSLQLQPPAGIHMELANQRIFEEAGEVSAYYSIRMIPVDLHPSESPSVLVVDSKGQTTVLTAKPLRIASISGTSLEILQPGKPFFRSVANSQTGNWTVAICGVLLILIFTLQLRRRTARAKLVRALNRALKEVRRGRLPFALWSALRSPLLWGFSAESKTGSELKQCAGANSQLIAVAELIESMERTRYAGKIVQPDAKSEQSIIAAIEWLKLRRSTQ